MINSVNLVGRLTKDVELRYTKAGKPVCSGTIAVNRTYTNQNGEREADFIRFTIWGKQAENTANYTRKGSLVGLQGELNTDSYDGENGKKVYTTEVGVHRISFLDMKKEQHDKNEK